MEYGDWLYIVALLNFGIRSLPAQLPDAFVNTSQEELEYIVGKLTEELEGLA